MARKSCGLVPTKVRSLPPAVSIIKMQKITIVGAGKIGSAVAFSLLHLKNNIREIVLIDVIKNLAEGESLDLQHTASAMKKNVKIIGTEDYSFAKNSDIVVIYYRIIYCNICWR